MLAEEECRLCARSLLQAERERRPAPRPSRAHPHLTIEDAYAIQACWTEARIAAGERLVGYKIGLTSRAMQESLQASEPIFGRIFDDALLRDGARIPAARFSNPRIEVELAFVLGTSLAGPVVDAEQALRATERVAPALEIVAYRTEVPRPLTDTIADNAAFGALVLCNRSVSPEGVDLAGITASLSCNGAPVASGKSSAVLGHPAAAVAWLASRLHRIGSGLERGQIVLTGSFTPPLAVGAGASVRADYGALGTIDVTLE